MKKKIASLLLSLLLLTWMLPCVQAAEEPTVSNLWDLHYYIVSCAQNLDGTIIFSYTEELDDVCQHSEELWDVFKNWGIQDGTLYFYQNTRRVELADIVYRTGFRIAEADRTGAFGILNEEEQATHAIARQIANEALASSDTQLEVERYIHDAICRITTYEQTEDLNVPHDSAVGALYYGRAECDGYADAFYLIGKLAGLNISYQTGDSYDEETGELAGHMWNRIFLNGGWHHVDVTWDDLGFEDDSSICTYRYFNLGYDMMMNHSWKEHLVYNETVGNTDWNVFFYTCGQGGQEGFGAYYESLEDAAWYVASQWRAGARSAHVMVKDGYHEDSILFNEYLTKTDLYGSWTSWADMMGEYTCFDVLFYD